MIKKLFAALPLGSTPNPYITALARHLATKAAGVLVAHGLIKGGDVETVIGFVIFGLGVAWSWIEKRRAAGTSEPPKPATPTPPPALVLVFAVLLVSLAGCARFHSSQVCTFVDGRRVESHQEVVTFLASKTTVAKLRASTTEKTQGLSVGTVDQESNASDLVGAAVRAAIEAAK